MNHLVALAVEAHLLEVGVAALHVRGAVAFVAGHDHVGFHPINDVDSAHSTLIFLFDVV